MQVVAYKCENSKNGTKEACMKPCKTINHGVSRLMSKQKYPLIFVVALPCEAKPLTAFYQLKRIQAITVLKVFENNGVWLVVSGVGKVASAAAVGFMAGYLSDIAKKAIWLNIGIARHPLMKIGDCVGVNKAVDAATGQSTYPVFCVPSPMLAATCLTVDASSNDMKTDALFEREASGFFFAAQRHTTAEFVHAFKMVSDNRHRSADTISANEVTELMGSCIQSVTDFLQKLMSVRDDYWKMQDASHELYSQLIAEHHFTQSLRLKLSKVLKRIYALQLQKEVLALNATNAKALIQSLEEIVDKAPVVI